MSWASARMTLRLRLVSTISASLGLIAVLLAVGALFPAVGHTIGKLNIPKGVAELLGGADYGTITGWFRSEIGSIYGPLVIGALAIASAAASTAGEEEDRILTLVLGHPLARSRLAAARALAVALIVLAIAAATWVGMVSGVALGGGGIGVGDIAAFSLQLAFFGFATGAIALALGAGTGRRTLAVGNRCRHRHPRLADQRVRPAGQWTVVAQVPLAVLLLRRTRPADQRCRRRGRRGARRRRDRVHGDRRRHVRPARSPFLNCCRRARVSVQLTLPRRSC